MYRLQIIEALKKVVSEHGYTNPQGNPDIHEISLAHRLAYHIENSGYFVGYNIDCEYNRDMGNPKRDKAGNIFRPDIIIHKRNSNEANLIMIETKKFNDPDTEIELEKERLRNNKRHYHYSYGYLVSFPENVEQLDEEENVIEIY
jgi:hypothetical protein